MVDEYNIANKYKLTAEISTEPFGTYYIGETADQKKYLILLLSFEASSYARPHVAKLQDKLQDKLVFEDTNPAEAICPVLEIVDLISSEHTDIGNLDDNLEVMRDQGIMIVMPYLEGKSLASSISDLKKPLSLRKTLKLLSPLTKRITDEHKAGKFHGFINFSTIWLTKDNKLKLLGFDIFNVIFEKLEVKTSELYHPKISSCLSEDNQIAKITFSIASDYYAILIIICSLLQGSIPTTKNYLFTPIQHVDKKARRLLTADYYREAYQQNITLDQWIAQLQSTIKWPVLENLIAVILVVGLITVVSYQNREQIKSSVLASYYNSLRNNYISIVNYLYDHRANNKLAAASGSINKSVANPQTGETLDKTDLTKVASAVSNLDIENNLFNYTSNNDYKHVNSAHTNVELAQPAPSSESVAVASQNRGEAVGNDSNMGKTEGLKCSGPVCRELIVDSIAGPKMIKSALLNEQFWLMQSPLSRRDYYTYCYFVEDCKQKKDIVNNKVLKCLFENACNDETELWLNYPITGLEMQELNKYLSWLNKVTNGGYEVLPDKYWPIIASRFKPDQNCIFVFNGSNDYMASSKPELVTVNNKLAIRSAAKMIERESTGELQCQTLLSENVSSVDKNVVIRLAKKIA